MSSTDDFSKAVDITKQMGTHAKRMVKPKDIPIYGEENVIQEDKNVSKPDALLNAVKDTRLAVQDAYHQVEDVVSPIKENAINILETGKSHTQATYQMIQDEQNVLVHAAVIGGSGILGFTIASFARRARFFKRLLFSSIGAGIAASICYPNETGVLAMSSFEETKRLGLIAYNFVQGVKPNDVEVLPLAVEPNKVNLTFK